MVAKNCESDFWQRVTRSATGCWAWSGGTDKDGYGFLRFRGRRVKAHRLAWELLHGPIPQGMFVLHRCDNPPCVRPDHLFLGTNDDNMADMAKKGRAVSGSKKHPERMPRGEEHPRAKLTEEGVRRLREKYCAGDTSQQLLAKEFGISQFTVSAIIRRKRWAHVR